MIGHVGKLERTLVGGWAADPSHPEASVRLRLLVDGKATEFAADLHRPDLTGRFPGSTGRYGFRFAGEPFPLSPFVPHEVTVLFAVDGKPVPGGRAVVPPVGSPARIGRRQPVLVTTTGRAGSSLLMARLARHPGVLVGREHPHELKLLSYYALALQTLLAGADRKRSTDPDTMLNGQQFFVGFNPFHDAFDARDPDFLAFWDVGAPDALRDCFVRLLDEYYDRVAHGTGKPRATLFAEKTGTSALGRQAAGWLYGAVHELLLVRDPRDVICSARAFWKRGFTDSVAALEHGFGQMDARRLETGLRQHVVRYEDLIRAPAATMRGVFAFLDVEGEAQDDTEGEGRVFVKHGTSASPEETTGRWRKELTGEELEVVRRRLGPFLRRYGYDDDS